MYYVIVVDDIPSKRHGLVHPLSAEGYHVRNYASKMIFLVASNPAYEGYEAIKKKFYICG